MKFSEIMVKKEFDDDETFEVVPIESLFDDLVEIRKINFYNDKEGTAKVFIGLADGRAVCTASDAIMSQLHELRGLLGMKEIETMTPEPVVAKFVRRVSKKSGRTYYALE